VVVCMRSVGKIKTESSCARLNKLANHVRATGCWSNSGNNFGAAKSFSNGHGLSANGEPQTYQNVMTIRHSLHI
jgi:hypothetical protein